MAEGEGFEPPVGCPTAVFKTAALVHSAIPPGSPGFPFRARAFYHAAKSVSKLAHPEGVKNHVRDRR